MSDVNAPASSGINWGAELDKVEEATKPIAEGPHQFRLVEAKVVKAASSGNTMIRLTCKVEGGPDDGKTGMVNLVFAFDSPRAMKMNLKRLANLGITSELLKAENPSVEQIASKLLGRLVTGTVTHRPWNDEIQNDIDFIGSGTTPAGVPDAPSIPTPNVEAAPPTPQVPSQPETPTQSVSTPGAPAQSF